MSIKLSLTDQPNAPIAGQSQMAQKPANSFAPAEGLDYVNRAVGQAEQRLAQMFDEELAVPEAGTDLANSIIGRFEAEQTPVLDQAPNEQARQSLQHKLSTIAERGVAKAVGTEQVQKVAARADSAEQTLNIYRELAKRDPDEAQTYLGQGHQLLEEMRQSGIKGEAIDQRGQDFHLEIIGSALNGVVERDPAEAVVRFDAGEFDALFRGEDEKANAKAKLQQVIETGQFGPQFKAELLEQVEVKRQEGQRLISEAALDQKLDDGAADQAEIAQAFWRGDIDEQEKDHYLRKFRAKSDASWAKQRQVDRIKDVLRSGEVLDVDDPMAAAAVDAYFDDVIKPNIAELDPQLRQRVEDNFIRNVGTVPGEILKPVRGALLAGEPAEQVAAAKRIKALVKTDPNLQGVLKRHFDPVEIIKVQIIGELDDLRIPAEKIIPLMAKRIQALLKSNAIAKTGFHSNIVKERSKDSAEFGYQAKPSEDDTASGNYKDPDLGVTGDNMPGTNTDEDGGVINNPEVPNPEVDPNMPKHDMNTIPTDPPLQAPESPSNEPPEFDV